VLCGMVDRLDTVLSGDLQDASDDVA